MTSARAIPGSVLTAEGAHGARPVVVALAADGADTAMQHGARLARAVRAPLHLLHVVPLRPHGASGERSVAHAVRAGDDLLRDAAARARSWAGEGTALSVELAHGDPLDRLVAAGRTARALVLERRVPPGGAFRDDGTCARAAALTPGTVLVVPRAWAGGATVTVAVDDVATCAPLLDQALAATEAGGARLTVLHVLAERDRGVWQTVRRTLTEVLTERAGAWPRVDTHVELVHGRPAVVVVEASVVSGLLVIGRGGGGRHHETVGLGAVTRAALHDAACPVLLPDLEGATLSSTRGGAMVGAR